MISIEVLGPLRVIDEGGEIVPLQPLARRLLAVLLAARGPIAVDVLIDRLWDEPPSNPHAALQTAVSRLRRHLGAEAVARDGGGYRLDVPGQVVDADRFESLVTASHPAEDPRQTLREAVSLWRGDTAYVEFLYDDLVDGEIERLAELRVRALEQLAAARLSAGEPPELIVPEVESLLAEHPLREGLYELHMLALYRSGRQADALRSYRSARARLGDELGIHPSARLNQLEEDILVHAPHLDPEDSKSASTNVPNRIASVVGREMDVATLEGSLESARLVTVSGPGGVGKTTVATEAARRIARDARVDAWFIELAGVERQDRVAGHIASELASHLGVAVPTGRGTDPLVDLIGHRHLLLLIDNAEQVVDAVAEVVADVLRRCPRATVWVTSRERLAVPGERNVVLNPLTTPAADDEKELLWMQLGDYSAVQLFLERATEAGGDIQPTEDTAPVLSRIARRLDGLPLAIEMAAAQAGVMSLDDIERQLDRAVSSLAGRRGVDRRHSSLEAAISWSYERLSHDAQQDLQLLSSFSSPFTIPDAASLLDVPESQATAAVTRLHQKSLLRSERFLGDRSRFTMLETVRQFAQDRAAATDRWDEVAVRHAEHIRRMCVEAGSQIPGGPRQIEWIERLNSSYRDVLAAFDTFIERDMPEGAVEVVGNLGLFFIVSQRRIDDGARLARVAIRAAGARVYEAIPKCHRTALLCAIWSRSDQIEKEDLDHHAQLAISTAAALGQSKLASGVKAVLSYGMWLAGDPKEATSLAAEAVDEAGDNTASFGLRFALGIWGLFDLAMRDTSSALTRLQQSIDLADANEDAILGAWVRWVRGTAARLEGDLDLALTLYQESAVRSRSLGDHFAYLGSMLGSALTAEHMGNRKLALDHAQAAVRLARRRPVTDAPRLSSLLYSMPPRLERDTPLTKIFGEIPATPSEVLDILRAQEGRPSPLVAG